MPGDVAGSWCSASAWSEVGGIIGAALGSPDYDPTRLPNPSGVNVSLSFLVQEITSLSEITSDFVLDILYDEQWLDPRLNFSSQNLCRNNFTLKPEYRSRLWRPDTCVVNSKDAQIHASPSNNSFVILHDTGLLWASYRLKIKAPCRLDLTMFPFDSQTCILQFESYSLNADEVILNWKGDIPIGFLSEIILPDFVLIGWRVRRLQLEYPNGRWDRLEANFVFSRLYGYYFVQAYFPTLLTVCCSWLTFLLETRSVSARLSLSVSSLLALTFQLSTVTEELPRVSYLKCIDIWLFACILSIFSVNLEVAAVAFLSRYERARQVGALMILGWLQRLRESRVPKDSDSDSVQRNSLRRPAVVGLSAEDEARLGDSDGLIRSGPRLSRFDSASSSTSSVSRLLGSLKEDAEPAFRLRWAHAAAVFRSFWALAKTLNFRQYWRAVRRLKCTSSTVDNISMVMFPLSFLMFNVVYWSYYISYIWADLSHNDLHFV